MSQNRKNAGVKKKYFNFFIYITIIVSRNLRSFKQFFPVLSSSIVSAIPPGTATLERKENGEGGGELTSGGGGGGVQER